MEDRTNSFQEAEDKPGELPMGVSSDITAVPRHLTGRVRMHTLAPSHLDTCLLWVLSAPSQGLSLLTRMPHHPQLLAGPHQQPLCSGFPFATSTHPLPSLFTLLPASGVQPSFKHHHPPGIWMSKRRGRLPLRLYPTCLVTCGRVRPIPSPSLMKCTPSAWTWTKTLPHSF